MCYAPVMTRDSRPNNASFDPDSGPSRCGHNDTGPASGPARPAGESNRTEEIRTLERIEVLMREMMVLVRAIREALRLPE